MTYSFDKEKHVHSLDGKNLYGITSVLSVISKPALIQWSANQAVDYIRDNLPLTDDHELLRKAWEIVYKEARTAHARKRDKAGDWGTKVHEAIEYQVKALIKLEGGVVHPNMVEDVKKTFDHIENRDGEEVILNFWKWAIDNKVKFLRSEQNLYSEKLWLGGIVDLIFEKDGKTWIGDIKTGSGIYPEMYLQCAGYDLMLEEMGMKIDGYEIINLKKNGEMQTARSYGTERNKEGFLSALTLFKTLEELKKENGNN